MDQTTRREPMVSTDDENAVTRTEAKRRVVIAGHEGDVLTVLTHLDHPDPGVRASAISALARADGLDAATLTAALTDPHHSVRRRAAEIAATGVVPASEIDLLPLLDDEDDRVIETVAWAIGELDPHPLDAIEPLCQLVANHTDSLVREAAVAALGAIGHPDALPTILSATTDIATVRRRAIIALAPFDGPEVDAALERALDDRDWQVRQAAEDLSD